MPDGPRAVFFGSPDFAVPCLEVTAAGTDLRAVVSQPDRPAGRGKQLHEPAVKVAAHAPWHSGVAARKDPHA